MIVDAWMQHPSGSSLNQEMFASLRRWTKSSSRPTTVTHEMTIAAMDEGNVTVGGHLFDQPEPGDAYPVLYQAPAGGNNVFHLYKFDQDASREQNRHPSALPQTPPCFFDDQDQPVCKSVNFYLDKEGLSDPCDRRWRYSHGNQAGTRAWVDSRCVRDGSSIPEQEAG